MEDAVYDAEDAGGSGLSCKREGRSLNLAVSCPILFRTINLLVLKHKHQTTLHERNISDCQQPL